MDHLPHPRRRVDTRGRVSLPVLLTEVVFLLDVWQRQRHCNDRFMNPLIRVKAVRNVGPPETISFIWDVYESDPPSPPVVATGTTSLVPLDSAEQGELEAIRDALLAVRTYSEGHNMMLSVSATVVVESDSQNIRSFLDGKNETETHSTLRDEIKDLLNGATVMVRPLPEDLSDIFRRVARS